MNTSIADKYILIDGLRRVAGAARAGKTKITALVIKFVDQKKAKKALPILELLFNMREPYSMREIWERARFLETRMENFTPDRIEFLLQLNAGDYTKLVDIMTSTDVSMVETKQELLEGKLSIDAAYKKLTKLRKTKGVKEKLIQQELGIPQVANTQDDLQDMTSAIVQENVKLDIQEKPLSEVELQELINTSNEILSDIQDISLKDLDKTSEVRKTETQKKGERKPVDPGLRRARMIRDNFTCQCCGLHGEAHMYILDFHHIVPVSEGGPDHIDNGITVCLNCHQLIHLYAAGDLFVDFNTLEQQEIEKFKRIMVYGNIIINIHKYKGQPIEEIRKELNPHFVGRKYPGTIKKQLDSDLDLEFSE